MSLSPEPIGPIFIEPRPQPQPVLADTSSSSAKERELKAIGIVLDELARPGFLVDTVLRIIAEESAVITGATGAAIVLLENAEFVCRASCGAAAPLGSKLDTSSGISGECVRTGSAVRCDDAETDSRVNAEGCRALNVRSIAAVPLVRSGEVVGLLEVFSSRAQAFTDDHLETLQRMASAVLAAVNRSASSVADAPSTNEFLTSFGESDSDTETAPSFSWRRGLLAILAIALIVGGAFASRRWLNLPRIRLSHPNAPQAVSSTALPQSALAAELRIAADAGDANSQFLLGLLYVRGQEVPEDYQEAAKWFALAAQQGNISAQSMLGALYLAGRGVQQDYVSAYLWTRLAADAGNEISKKRLPQLTTLLPPDRLSEAQNRVSQWRKIHPSSRPRSGTKPRP